MIEKELKNRSDITILIPLRIDSKERKDNMDACLSFFADNAPNIRIIVLEADAESKYIPVSALKNLTYMFVEDHAPVFHRTRYLNMMLRKVQTLSAGIWDSDVIVPVTQIYDAVNLCREGATLCYPYDGRFYTVSPHVSIKYRQIGNIDILCSDNSLHQLAYGYYSAGGAFVVDVAKYLSAGGENENFYGWGPEDTERRERICTWGLTVKRTDGCLYHLYHPRGINSDYAGYEHEMRNRREFLKICKMSRNELKEYIINSAWHDFI